MLSAIHWPRVHHCLPQLAHCLRPARQLKPDCSPVVKHPCKDSCLTQLTSCVRMKANAPTRSAETYKPMRWALKLTSWPHTGLSKLSL